MAERGSRSNVILPQEAPEDMEAHFDAAKSPTAESETNRRSSRSAAAAAPARSTRTPKSSVRYSLPGQAADNDDEEQEAPASSNLAGVTSPSELSKVSTLPPTPATALQQVTEDVEISRMAATAGEEPAEQVVDQDPVEFSPPVDDNDEEEEGDDLAPPALDDDDFPENPPMEEPLGEEEGDRKPAARPSPMDADLEDDDDKEGPGFDMAQDSDDQEDESIAAKEAQKKKKKKKRVSIASDVSDKTPVPKNRRKKNQRGPLFSPKGIPTGNRDYERIPIVEPSPDDAGGLRRSQRSKVKPLEFWRNERVEYGPAEDDDFVEMIGDMPLPKAIMRAQDTPYRKRKDTGKTKNAKSNKNKKGKRKAAASVDDDDDDNDAIGDVFDYSKLKKKYKNNLLETEDANIWDDGIDVVRDLSKYFQRVLYCFSIFRVFLADTARFLPTTEVVAYADKMEAADLPPSHTRTKHESTIVGKAAQGFNIPPDPNDNYAGYIMGTLFLPPLGIKDAESVGPCSQTFTICTGQKKSIELAYADPDAQGGMLDRTAQRFMLGPGDLFRIPPGNTYRLENHSKTKSCLLSWTIIRPRAGTVLGFAADEASTPYSSSR